MRKLLPITILLLGFHSAWAGDSFPIEEVQWTAFEKGLRNMDHAAREAFSASFERKKRLETSIFLELHRLLTELKQSDNTQGQPKATLCLARVSGSPTSFQLLDGHCNPRLVLAKLQFSQNKFELELPLGAWSKRLAISPNARSLHTRCQGEHEDKSLHRLSCRDVSLVTENGLELVFARIAYDQGANNLVKAKGQLHGLAGHHEEVEFKAPAKSNKLIVDITTQEEPQPEEPSPAEPSREQEEFAEAEPEAEVQPKSEEEVLAEMEALAADWKAVHGIQDEDDRPSQERLDEKRHEYLEQDLAIEESSEREAAPEAAYDDYRDGEEGYEEGSYYEEEAAYEEDSPRPQVDFAEETQSISFGHSR